MSPSGARCSPSSPTGKMVFTVLGAVAELKRSLIAGGSVPSCGRWRWSSYRAALTAPAVARIVHLSPQAVRRIGHRYKRGGLESALFERQGRGAEPLLEAAEKQRIIAMVCSPPPPGYARCTVRLVAEQTVKRKLVPRVGRETVRVLLLSHDLKPWREKMGCVAELNQEYIAKMEDVLATYEKPYNPAAPVVCVDEKPVSLHADLRPPIPAAPGRIAKRDNEYKRCG